MLKRLADAERDGDRVYAVIRGTGVASDGRTASLINPDSGGQVRAVRQAWAAAGPGPARGPDSIGLLEAHGTATPAGDAAELATLAEVFGTGGGLAAVLGLGEVDDRPHHARRRRRRAGQGGAGGAPRRAAADPALRRPAPGAGARPGSAARTRPRPWESPAAGAPGRRQRVRLRRHQRPRGAWRRHGPAAARPSTARRPCVTEPERVLRLAAPTADALPRCWTPTTGGAGRRLDEPPRRRPPSGSASSTRREAAGAGPEGRGRGAAWRGRSDVWFSPRPLLGPGGGTTRVRLPRPGSGVRAHGRRRRRPLRAAWRTRHDRRSATSAGTASRVFGSAGCCDAALRRMGVVPDAVAGHSVGEWTAMARRACTPTTRSTPSSPASTRTRCRVPGLGLRRDRRAPRRPGARRAGRPGGRRAVPRQRAEPVDGLRSAGGGRRARAAVPRRGVVVGQVLPFRSGFHTPMLRPVPRPDPRGRPNASRCTRRQLPLWSATTVAAPYPADAAGIRELFVRHLLEPVRFRPLDRAPCTPPGSGRSSRSAPGSSAPWSATRCTARTTSSWRRTRAAPRARAAAPGRDRAVGRRARRAADRRFGWWRRLPRRVHPPARRAPWPRPGRQARPRRPPDLPATRRSVRGSPCRPPGRPVVDRLAAGRDPLAAEFAAAAGRHRRTGVAPCSPDRATPASRRRSRTGRPPSPSRSRRCRTCSTTASSSSRRLADPADRWPVVPATTVIDHLMRFAEQAAPGRRAVAVHDVRLSQWITAVPSVTCRCASGRGADRVARGLRRLLAGAVVELAAGVSVRRPGAVAVPGVGGTVPETKAAELYDERWMFHGPRFQGVTELTAIGERHVAGRADHAGRAGRAAGQRRPGARLLDHVAGCPSAPPSSRSACAKSGSTARTRPRASAWSAWSGSPG